MADKLKVCMLGTFAVGKTSLVRRYVENAYDEKYITSVGALVEKKVVKVDEKEVTMLIWDIQGEDDFQRIKTYYLKGMAGYFLVSDGTRHHTLTSSKDIQKRVEETIGKLPCIYLLNKADQTAKWEINKDDVIPLLTRKIPVLNTSAKTGQNVEKAFELLARMMVVR